MSVINKKSPVPNPQASTSKKTNFTVPIIIGVALLALLAGGYFAYPFVKNLLFPPPQIIAVEEKPEIIPEEPPVVIQESTPSIARGYYIIVGSFRDRNRADLMVSNLKNTNLNLEVLHFEDIGAYRISAGHYDNIHSAYNRVHTVMDMMNTPNVWVLENI